MAITKEVFGNCSSCVAAAGSGGTNGTSAPSSGTTESWTVSTGSTSFPVANHTLTPATFFYVRDPADATNEIVMVTDNNSSGSPGTSWSVTRGACSTTPVAHASGATWVQVISPGTLQNFKQSVSAGASAVTVANSTTETVLATYTPTPDELVAGATWEAIAFGPWAKANGTGLVLRMALYWGGSGSVGGAFTSTGSALLARLQSATNANMTALAQTLTAGASYDMNAQITWLSSTTAVCQMNMWYTNAANLTTTGSNAQTVNTNDSNGQSQAGPITISGSGPIILTAKWGTPSASDTITAVAPIIYRQV